RARWTNASPASDDCLARRESDVPVIRAGGHPRLRSTADIGKLRCHVGPIEVSHCELLGESPHRSLIAVKEVLGKRLCPCPDLPMNPCGAPPEQAGAKNRLRHLQVALALALSQRLAAQVACEHASVANRQLLHDREMSRVSDVAAAIAAFQSDPKAADL